MQIEYVTNRSRRMVSDTIGRTLVARKIAREIEARQVRPEPSSELESVIHDGGAIKVSERTGKPKRKYKRRDMKAES